MVLDNILPGELDPADRIREIAMKDKLDMRGSRAHLIEDEIAQTHKVRTKCDLENQLDKLARAWRVLV